MLDPTMTYSCAIFEGRATSRSRTRSCGSSAASARSSSSGRGDRVLEIGCGWGSFALVAAGEYGAHVTGLTLSAAQAALARERVAAAGLEERVAILEEDYRVHRGTLRQDRLDRDDRGDRREAVPGLLRRRRPLPRARRASRACRRSSSRTSAGRGTGTTPDWIERHVFPGCLIPSLARSDARRWRGRRG